MGKSLLLRINVDDKGNMVLEKLNKNLHKVGKTSKGVGSIFKGVFAAKLVRDGINQTILGMKAITAEGLKFQQTFKQVEGITQTTGKSLELLKDVAITSSNATEHLSSSVATAAFQISKMGFTVEQSVKAMPSIMNLATDIR